MIMTVTCVLSGLGASPVAAINACFALFGSMAPMVAAPLEERGVATAPTPVDAQIAALFPVERAEPLNEGGASACPVHSGFDRIPTSASLPCWSSEAGFYPYQNPRSSRYDPLSLTKEGP
jgi:hypothetical protein